VGAEANETIKTLLTFSQPAGPLSGKTTAAAAIWLPAWGALHLWLKNREVNMKRAVRLTWALVGIGLIGTFPPFYQRVALWF
jgi:hypothetical protein